MKPYKLSKDAENDLMGIFEYGLINFDEALASEFCSALEEKCKSIAATPDLHQPIDNIKMGYRRAVYRSYSIFFKETDDFVLIVRIARKELHEKLFN